MQIEHNLSNLSVRELCDCKISTLKYIKHKQRLTEQIENVGTEMHTEHNLSNLSTRELRDTAKS